MEGKQGQARMRVVGKRRREEGSRKRQGLGKRTRGLAEDSPGLAVRWDQLHNTIQQGRRRVDCNLAEEGTKRCGTRWGPRVLHRGVQ